jgi:uncharacterized repeat protein (TIGR01451 family)
VAGSSRVRSLATLLIVTTFVMALAPSAQGRQAKRLRSKSAPPDTTHYVRDVIHQDRRPGGVRALAPLGTTTALVVDPVVNNTDPTLTNTDTGPDGEPSIAVNPQDPDQITISAFSANAGFWNSTDGGDTWTFQATYTQPPGSGGIPNDQQPDYARGNLLATTFLTFDGNIVTGTTTNPANQASWNWPLDGSGNVVLTNTTGAGNSDQPWLVTAPQPGNPSQDNIYVAYDDFDGGPDMQVNVSAATDPPNFTNDVQVGTTSLCCGSNPGLRLAADEGSGAVYALWQDANTQNADGSVNANIHLNRTIDGGATWTLNGSATGVVVASGTSNQRNPKFGTVNALIGGVHHAAVDAATGDVYVVYACGDGVGADNPLCIVRLTDDGAGGLAIGAPGVVTTLHSALPSVAVASNGVVGVLFTTSDGMSGGFPQFSAHFSHSHDQGATWDDQVLETFLSPVNDNGNNRQRVLGDYQEVVSEGPVFYGTFTGNGAPFGRPVSNMDPIFFRIASNQADLEIRKTDSPDPVAAGEQLTYAIEVENHGPETALDVEVTDTLPSEVTYVSDTAGCDTSALPVLTCSLGDLANGATTSFDIVVTVNADAASSGGPVTISNAAAVEALADDTNQANDSVTQDTTVNAVADLSIVSFDAIDPPAELLVGDETDVTLRKVITNDGPSAPIDVELTKTATASAGAHVSPTATTETETALALDEERTVDEVFTIGCDAPGAQTFTFDNEIQPADPDDIDPDQSNNTAQVVIVVECVVPVMINIRPGNVNNVVNLGSGMIVAVAVLTTAAGEYDLPVAFDATTIDAPTVRFGAEAVVNAGGGSFDTDGKGRIRDSFEPDDSTRDGDADMVLHFGIQQTGLVPADTEACVKGEFVIGVDRFVFFGCDRVEVVPT